MNEASLVLDPRFALAEVDRRPFGSFVEHMGRCVHTGSYEPGHPTVDHVGARLGQRRRLRLASDEWNACYQERFVGRTDLDWEYARPLIEDGFTVVDAVVVGSHLTSLLDHADRVAIGCQGQPVDVIAPILTEPSGRAWRQTIFHPFAQAARLARGRVLRSLLQSPPVLGLHVAAQRFISVGVSRSGSKG